MIDCHNDLIKFHNARVTLSGTDRAEMKAHRDANRRRLKLGLKEIGGPDPSEFQSQGSYALRTMIQDPKNDYDIDDGVFFEKRNLIGIRGGSLTPAMVKQLVCSGLTDSRFARQPEIRTNCVRIYYQEGYHVDMPVYRLSLEPFGRNNPVTVCELASSVWRRSNPLRVTKWFQYKNAKLSPDPHTNGGQLRRVVRLLKAFSRSRESWQPRMASGFMITVLTTNCYRPVAGRDDISLLRTMVAINKRLKSNLIVDHPTIKGETLMRGEFDARTRFFSKQLVPAVVQLRPVLHSKCTQSQALQIWGSVFATKFFTGR